MPYSLHLESVTYWCKWLTIVYINVYGNITRVCLLLSSYTYDLYIYIIHIYIYIYTYHTLWISLYIVVCGHNVASSHTNGHKPTLYNTSQIDKKVFVDARVSRQIPHNERQAIPLAVHYKHNQYCDRRSDQQSTWNIQVSSRNVGSAACRTHAHQNNSRFAHWTRVRQTCVRLACRT